MQTKRKLAVIPVIVAVVIIGEAVFGGLYFKKYNDLKSSGSKTTEQITKELVAKINKFYQLPTDETPTPVSVNKDPSEFTTDQEKQFSSAFKDLKKGDQILLYAKAGQAILYRPSENKVINTIALAINTGANVALIASPEAQTTLTETLTTKLASAIRIGGKSTPVGQYTATTVVDVSGKKTDIAKKVAEAIGGTVVTSLPVAEKIPDGAEIVVIAANAVATPATP